MKKSFCLLCVFYSLFSLFSASRKYHGIMKYGFQFVEIRDDNELLTEDDELGTSEKSIFWNSTLKPLESNNINYGVVQKFKNNFTNQELNLFIIESSNLLIIYNSQEKEPVFIGFNNFKNEGKLLPVISINASSCLKEGNKIYDIGNIQNLNSDMPWCEGVKDNGIGESFKILCPSNKLIFFNGYFSVNKNYLYRENSRLKKIRLDIPELNYSTQLELQDTFLPQRINIPISFNNEKRKSYTMIITISEVYEGSKYSDTCLSGVFFDFD